MIACEAQDGKYFKNKIIERQRKKQRGGKPMRIAVSDNDGWFDSSEVETFKGIIDEDTNTTLILTRKQNWVLQTKDDVYKVSKEFAMVWLLKNGYDIDKIFDTELIEKMEL